MYKVLIADDERLIRMTLKNILDWNALDCVVIATCKDGEEAYRLFQEGKPDIVITDLKMPEMDGIELISKIKAVKPATQVVVLSNYSDFELVRDAMKAGADDYMLKVTLDAKDFEKIVQQCIERYGDVPEDLLETKGIKELQQCLLLTQNEHVMNEQMYQDALSMDAFDGYEDNYALAYFRVDHINDLYEEKYQDHVQLKNNIENMIQDSLSTYGHYRLVFISNHSGVILFKGFEHRRIASLCQNMIRNMKQYLAIHLSITLSDIMHSFVLFEKVYAEILNEHSLRFYLGEGVLIQGNYGIKFNHLSIPEVSYHRDLYDAYDNHDEEAVNQLIHSMCKYMHDSFIDPEEVLDYFIFTLNYIESKDYESGKPASLPYRTALFHLRSCETLDKMKNILSTFLNELIEWTRNHYKVRYRKEVVDLISYIEAHYAERLSLHKMSEDLGLKESSISRMFKHETGMNLTYYINEIRMKKAMELLKETDMLIRDVAVEVGIDDQLYFNKVFKKFYRVSPSDIRRK